MNSLDALVIRTTIDLSSIMLEGVEKRIGHRITLCVVAKERCFEGQIKKKYLRSLLSRFFEVNSQNALFVKHYVLTINIIRCQELYIFSQ